MFKKIHTLLSKIKKDRTRSQELWKLASEFDDLQAFLENFGIDADMKKYFEEGSRQRQFIAILDKLSSPREFEDSIGTFFLSNFQDDYYKMLENELIEINGDQISIQVNYNPERLDLKYSYKNLFQIKKCFEVFIKTLIPHEKFYVQSPLSSLFILDGKKYSFNEYTDPYFFDPFFGSILIELKKKEGEFKKSFTIKNSDKIQISFTQRQDPGYWHTEKTFTSDTKIEEFIEHICTKERADPSIYQLYLEKLKVAQKFNTVGDLFKVKKQEQLTNLILPKKWINELLIEIEKCQRQETRCPFKRFRSNRQKLDCLRRSYSHKILRYLFFKINKDCLEELNKSIPYLSKDIIDKSILLIRKQLFIQELFDQLKETFQAFAFIPEHGKHKTPYGILFYGPPGTGKTQLTEVLAQLMGFHLISNGLSSTNFMKELVGGAKGTVQGYFKRALESPHLICSIAIDEIDPLIQKRQNGGGSKGSDETISKFLSMMGGNQSVQNLLVLGSTNLFNKIDDAMLRRFNRSFYVGLPSKEDRKNILNFYHPQLRNIGVDIQFLTSITPNFSGAGLQEIAKRINEREDNAWDKFKLMQLVDKVAKSLKLYIGSKTYPQLRNLQENEQMISLDFFQRVQKKALFFLKDQSRYSMCYQFNEQEFKNGKISDKFVFCQNQLKIQEGYKFRSLKDWLEKGQNQFQDIDAKTFDQVIGIETGRIRTSTTIVFFEIKRNWENVVNWLLDPNPNPKVFFVLYSSESQIGTGIKKFLSQASAKTGRVLVDLSQQYPKVMEFELKEYRGCSRTQAYPILGLNRQIINQEEVYPAVVSYLINQNVGNIQVIDNFFFGASNMFDDKECLSAIHGKMEELKHYKKSAIIIDFDSILKLNKSISESETGPSKSLSIDRPLIYRELLNITTKMMNNTKEKQVWIALIVKDLDLAKILREDTKWPKSILQLQQYYEEQKKKKQKEQNEKQRQCKYCYQIFTEEENKKQRDCEAHYGEFIEMQSCKNMGEMTLEEARYETEIRNHGREKAQEYFLYSCCWKKISEAGCRRKFRHYAEGSTEADEILAQRVRTKESREVMTRKFEQNRRRQIDRIQQQLRRGNRGRH